MSKPRSSPRQRPRALPKSPRTDWRSAISKKIKGGQRLFVLGIGNRRKGDDAAGSLCVRLLKKDLARRKRGVQAADSRPGPHRGRLRELPFPGFQVLDAGESPESFTSLIRDFQPTYVIIIDAAVAGQPPGTIFVLDRKKIRQDDVSTHRLPLSLLARYLEESIGCRVVLVGIEPRDIAWETPPSVEVKTAAVRLAAWLSGFLAA